MLFLFLPAQGRFWRDFLAGGEGSLSAGKTGVGWGGGPGATLQTAARRGSLHPSGSLSPVFPAPEQATQAAPLLCACFLRSRGRGKGTNWVRGVGGSEGRPFGELPRLFRGPAGRTAFMPCFMVMSFALTAFQLKSHSGLGTPIPSQMGR